MAIAFRCARYPTLRVSRGDGTYLEFHNSIAYAESEADAQLLRHDITGEIFEIGEDGEDLPRPKFGGSYAPLPLKKNLVSWYSPMFGTADGYGSSAEQMIRGLERRGYDVRCHAGHPVTGQTYIADVLQKPFERGSLRVVYAPPNASAWHRESELQTILGFTMWEDDMLPPSYDDMFRQVDALAAPSRFTVDLMQKRVDELELGIAVSYIPLGIEPALFEARRRDFKRGNEKFVVLHSATNGTEHRKGPDIAYAAFKAAFGDQTDVKLVMRSRFAHIAEVNGDPRVEVMEGVVPDERKAEIMYGAHVLLYPSRGEGFGLIPIEALATGLPSIVSANSAMLDYVNLCVPIPCKPAPSQITTPWCLESTGQWAEPDFDATVAALRDVYENYPKHAARAMRSAKTVRTKWTFDQTTDALVVALEEARAARNARLLFDSLAVTV